MRLCVVRDDKYCYLFVFFFKQKTAYEMRISDWSSDVCSSDLILPVTLTRWRRKIDLVNSASAKRPSRTSPRLRGPGPGSGSPLAFALRRVLSARSEERRVGKECVSTCRSRWSPYH